jgi:PAS domain S-box-containing protein
MGEILHSADHSATSADAPMTMSASALDAASWSSAIIESCSEAIISTSLDGHIVGWNAAATQLSGYTADEVIGRHWQFLVTAADQVPEIARAVRRFHDGEKNFRIESHLRRKDGVHLRTLLSISAIRDRSGTLLGLSGMFRDITEEKLAETKLRQSEEKFKTVFKYSSDSISLSSMPDGRYLDVNDEFCRMLRLPAEKIIGKTSVELGILTAAQQDGLAMLAEQGGGLRNHEVSLTDRDGVPRRLLVSSVNVELDNLPCALGIIKDITDLKRAEDDLLRIERQLNDVLANAPLAVIAFDSNRVVTAARGRALATMQMEENDLIAKPLAQIFEADNPALLSAERALAGESFSAIENVQSGKRWFEVWYSPMRDFKHRVVGATAVATDVTERKHAEDELRRSEEYYRSLVESSSDLTVVTNEAGIILFAAGEGHKDLGFEFSDLIGCRAMDFIHPDKHAEQTGLIAECFSRPHAIGRGEAPIRCKDGSWLECEIIGRAAIGPDGKPILVSTVRNISERKRAELEIARSRDQALAAIKRWPLPAPNPSFSPACRMRSAPR